MPKLAQDLPTRFREAASGLTQEQLAREVDLDQTYVSRILNGKVPGRKAARNIVARFPELRDVIANAMLEPAS